MPYGLLGEAVGISQGEAHNGVQRLIFSHLIRSDRAVNSNALYEFIVGGVPYAFAANVGPETRGIPTAHSAPRFADDFVSENVVVWPSAAGRIRGASIEPLYAGAPSTAQHNRPLYELLAAVDELRIGKARERERAKSFLRDRILERKYIRRFK